MMSWKSIFGYLTLGQCGSSIVSQCRYACSLNSSSHSGSFFFDEMSRIVSSLRPLGAVSDSISVLKPCSYGLLTSCSRTLLICFLHAEAFTAAARRVDVRVLELVNLFQTLFDEIECRAFHELEAFRVDEHFRAEVFEGLVARADFVGVVVGIC